MQGRSAAPLESPGVDKQATLSCDVSKAFGGVRAVEHAALAVSRGEVVGLIGPNGSGKSTLLDLLTGLQRPDRGYVALDGEDVTSLSVPKRQRAGIGRLFQHSRVFESLTVVENLRVPFGESWLERESEITSVLKELHLGGVEDAFAGDVSYGQQRLIEIARLLITRPRVMLLDEPTAGIHGGVIQILAEMIPAFAASGMAVIVVEHNMSFVEALCTRLYAMAAGSVVAQGEPGAVLSHPRVVDIYFGSDEVDAK